MEGKFGGTDLHKYAKASEWTKLLAASNETQLKTLNEHNRTPLHYAIESGAPSEILIELVRVGPFQARIRDVRGDTPLHLGCEAGMDLITTYSLLEADGKARGRQSVLTMKNKNGKTPVELIKGARRPDFFGNDLGVTWHYHQGEYDGVLAAIEEAASGTTGTVGTSVIEGPAAAIAAAQRRNNGSSITGRPKSTGEEIVCIAIPWTPPN